MSLIIRWWISPVAHHEHFSDCMSLIIRWWISLVEYTILIYEDFVGIRISNINDSVKRSIQPQSHMYINILRPRQNGRHFPDNIFKCIFLNENVWISLKISLKFIPKVRANKIPPLVQIMAWRQPDDKPLSEPMMGNSLTHICVTPPQWVKMTKWQWNTFWIIASFWEESISEQWISLTKGQQCGALIFFFDANPNKLLKNSWAAHDMRCYDIQVTFLSCMTVWG